MTKKKDQTQIELVTRQFIMPIITGSIINFILDEMSELDQNLKTLIIVILAVIFGVIYAWFYFVRKRPKQVIISRRTTKIMTIALIVAIILICIAALILYHSLTTIIFQVGWLILMILFIRFARSMPVAQVVPKSVLTGIVAVGLGAALSIGGAPIIGLVTTQGSVQLTIYNNCDEPLVCEQWGVWVPVSGEQTINVSPVTVVIRQEGDQVIVDTLFGLQAAFDLLKNVNVRFNGDLIEPGVPLRVNLMEQPEHELIITCR